MRFYRIISFFGSDGTGKTTHANLIAQYLTIKGYKIWRTSIKFHHTLSYLVTRQIVGVGKKHPYIGHYTIKNKELRRRISTPWRMLELMSLIPALIYRIFIPMLLGFTIICDRYLIDTIVVLSCFLGDAKLPNSFFASMLLRFIPRNSLLVFLDADVDVILHRKTDEPLSPSLINCYRKAYQYMVRVLTRYGFSVLAIDTSATSIGDVQKIVIRTLCRRSVR